MIINIPAWRGAVVEEAQVLAKIAINLCCPVETGHTQCSIAGDGPAGAGPAAMEA